MGPGVLRFPLPLPGLAADCSHTRIEAVSRIFNAQPCKTLSTLAIFFERSKFPIHCDAPQNNKDSFTAVSHARSSVAPCPVQGPISPKKNRCKRDRTTGEIFFFEHMLYPREQQHQQQFVAAAAGTLGTRPTYAQIFQGTSRVMLLVAGRAE